MSYIRTTSHSIDLISELKLNIESRKQIITEYKEYLTTSENESKHIIISRLNFENLLDEFEYTIKQSLQAIKSLEIENLNFKEIIAETRVSNNIYHSRTNALSDSENLYKEKILLTSNDNEELSNYKFKSPTHTNFNYIEYLNKFDAVNSCEKLDKDKNRDIEIVSKIEEEKDSDMNNGNKSISIKEDSNLNMIEKKVEYQFETFRDEDCPIYQDKNNNNNLNYDKQNELDQYNNNSQTSEKIKLNFDYSQIKDYEKFLTPIRNRENTNNNYDHIVEEICIENNQIKSPESPEILDKPIVIPSTKDMNDENHEKNYATYNYVDNNYSFTKEISIKEGLRRKIRSKSKSQIKTTNQNDPSDRNENIDEEEPIQILNSKKFSANNINRFDHRENIFMFDLINKINNDDRLKEFLAYEFGQGSFDKFLIKLNNSELNEKEIENIINYFIDLRSKPDGEILSTKDSIRNNREHMLYSQKRSNSSRSFRNKQNESVVSHNSRNSSTIKENKRDLYVEPIKFEKFLRTDKKEIKIKSNEKTSGINNFKKKARFLVPSSKQLKC